jgi:hypothetical protein
MKDKTIKGIMDVAVNKAAGLLRLKFGDVLTQEQINEWHIESARLGWAEIDSGRIQKAVERMESE